MYTRRNAPRTHRVIGLTTLGVLAGLLAFAAPVAAVNPPGNNGTIKIDGVEWDAHPNNEPHPGCTFQLDFYGYDEGDLWADVVFEAHAPTGSGVLLEDRVFIGEDDNSGGGSTGGLDAEAGTETDADGAAYYDLSAALASFEPNPQQGYHVYLTIHADGSRGADVKHKVFWIEACEAEAPEEGEETGEDFPTTGGAELGGSGSGELPEDITTGGGVQGGRHLKVAGGGFGVLPDTSMDPGDSPVNGLLVLGVAVALGGAVTAPLMRGAGARAR